jgi:ComF family protein
MALLSKINNTFLDFIAPDTCPLTGETVYSGDYFSEKGLADLGSLQPDYLLPMERILDRFGSDQVAITMVYGLASTEKSRESLEIVHRIKYGGRQKFGRYMGQLLGEHILKTGNRLLNDQEYSHLPKPVEYDLIIPIPLHRVKQKERGFNQAEVIGNGVADILGNSVDTSIVRRKKYSISQTRLGGDSRTKGTRDTYEITPKACDISGKRILLVDDVLTTGSTANTVGEILLHAGATRVDAACIIVSESDQVSDLMSDQVSDKVDIKTKKA